MTSPNADYIPDAIRKHLSALMIETFKDAVAACSSRTPELRLLQEHLARVEDIAAFLGFNLASDTAVANHDLYDYVRYDTDAEDNITCAQTMADALAEVRAKIDLLLAREAKRAAKRKSSTLQTEGSSS